MISKKFYLFFTLFLIFFITCAGLKGNVYKDHQVSYSIGELSSNWEYMKKNKDEVDLIFRDRQAGRTIVVNSVCEGFKETPLRVLTAHLLFGFSEVEIIEQQNVQIGGLKALRTQVEASLDNVPLILDLYVTRHGRCVFDLQYFARPEDFNGGRPDFEKFVRGFEVLKVK